MTKSARKASGDDQITAEIINFKEAAAALRLMSNDEFADDDSASPDEPSSRICDAEIWGTMTPEVAALPIALSVAENRFEKEWKSVPEAPFKAVFEGMFAQHKIGKKEGRCFVTGTLGQSKRRTKNNVLKNYMMGIDVDSGASLEDCFQKVRNAGLTCIFYSTHSHGSTGIEIAQDRFHRWAEKSQIDTTPTTESIRRYLREETPYVDDVVDAAEFIEKRQDDGMKLIIQTRPIDKFRMIFPLAKPFIYTEQDGAHKDVINLWSQKVLGLGRSFGIDPDPAARDPSRLFYLPRHSKEHHNYRVMLTCGRLIKFEDIPSAGTAKVSSDPFDQAAYIMGATARGQIVSPTLGVELRQWARDRSHGFDIAQVFKDHCEDKIRTEQSDSKLTIECPFDDDHSNPGDPDDQGCFVQSAGADAETFSFHCSHAGCAGRDRLIRMQKAMQEGWFPDSVLTDPTYDLAGIDDEDGRDTDVAGAMPCVNLRGTGCRFDPAKDADWICIAGKDRDPVCQPFEIVDHFEDGEGGNATFELRFQSMGRTKTCTVRRADLFSPSTITMQLAAMNFRIAGDGRLALELLRKLEPPVNGRWVDRRGWHEHAFLTVGGETIKQAGSAALPLRMLETTRPKFAPMGTMEGWKEAVAPVWEGNASGREHFALALMMGMAGPAFGLCHPDGFRMLALHGPTSRGKSLACKLLASVSGPALATGCYMTLRATSNGIEAMLPDLSGHTIALDEGQHMKAEHVNELVFMMEAGAGKIAANQHRSAREVRRFGGLAMMANEKPLAQKLKDAGVDVSPGFDARVLDINVAGVKDYPKGEATALTTRLYDVERHNGHALRMIVQALLQMSPERIKKQVERLTTALVGTDAGGLESRAMETLAWVWFAGMLGKKLGLVPATFSLGRTMRWARNNRVADASKPVSERVLSTLRTSIARRRRVDLYTWEKSDFVKGTDNIEEGYKGAAGYFYKARSGEELIILADALRGMAGNICSETEVAQYLHAAGYLRKVGKNLFHATLPMRDGNAERVKNYRVSSAFYLADTEEPESSAEAAD